MSEEPDPPPIPPRDPPPKPGSFDWIVGGTKVHEVDVPIETDGKIRVLRVERSPPSPERLAQPAMGYIVLMWGMLVLGLLSDRAEAPPTALNRRTAAAIGMNLTPMGLIPTPGRGRRGPNTYTETQRHDSTKTRAGVIVTVTTHTHDLRLTELHYQVEI